MNYDVDYFIKKFSKIPENKWATKDVIVQPMVIRRMKIKTDWLSKKCARGQCLVVKKWIDVNKFIATDESQKEHDALVRMFGYTDGDEIRIAVINNGLDSRYQQATPKQRVLSALYDLKEKIVYKTVRIESKITEYDLISNSN